MKQEVFAGIILAILGLLLCGKPSAVWTFIEKWKSHREEAPSAAFLWVCRAIGAAIAVVGILLIAGLVR